MRAERFRFQTALVTCFGEASGTGSRRRALAALGALSVRGAFGAPAGGALAGAALGGCGRGGRAPLGPSTVEGPARRYWLLELIRVATVAPEDALVADQGGCRYHVNAAGALWGDHWGWCDDFQILPAWSPGYAIATTVFEGATAGGYSRLLILPRLPGDLAVFGRVAQIERTAAATLGLTLGPWRVSVAAGHEARLGTEDGPVLVEGPGDAGHVGEVDPRPVAARVTYAARNYGDLDSRQIGGRGPIRP